VLKSKIQDQDALASYILVKKLMMPINKTPAYRLGLVNDSGMVVREPKGDEINSLTVLDRLVFKIKRLLGVRLTSLYSFLYVQSMASPNLYTNLVTLGTPSQRAETKRILNTIKKIK